MANTKTEAIKLNEVTTDQFDLGLDRVMIEPIIEEDRYEKIGLEIPKSQREAVDERGIRSAKLYKAKVIAVGPGREKPLKWNVGDTILCMPDIYEADLAIDEGDKLRVFLIMRDAQIVMRINPKSNIKLN